MGEQFADVLEVLEIELLRKDQDRTNPLVDQLRIRIEEQNEEIAYLKRQK